MKIKINLNIFLFVILFFITNQLDVYALTMIFALIHEIGHLICGILLGFKAKTLKIMPLGFYIEFKINVQDYNYKIIKGNIIAVKKALIALAGPIVNLIIIIIVLIKNLDINILYANLLILLFNLLPIYPLDGGRIIKNILIIFCGKRKAINYINVISNVVVILLTAVSSILIIKFKNIAIFIIIMFLWYITIKENNRYNTYKKIYKTIDKNYNYL